MNKMLNYQLFPRSCAITKEIQDIIHCFELEYEKIDSSTNNLKSDDVLIAVSVREHLRQTSWVFVSSDAQS